MWKLNTIDCMRGAVWQGRHEELLALDGRGAGWWWTTYLPGEIGHGD